MPSRVRSPNWFKIVAILLVLWGLLGCYSCVQQLRLGADAMGPADTYQHALYAALPAWYNPCFVVAVLSGTVGAVALLVGTRVAVSLAIVALATVVIMFGYIFLVTDLIAHEGFATAAGFPIVIAVIAVAQLWLSREASARGWIG